MSVPIKIVSNGASQAGFASGKKKSVPAVMHKPSNETFALARSKAAKRMSKKGW